MVMTRMEPDVLTICENCDERPSISVTDDDVDLCAECELALIDEMAQHEDACDCTKVDEEIGVGCGIACPACTCGVAGRVERRKVWLREQIAQAAAE